MKEIGARRPTIIRFMGGHSKYSNYSCGETGKLARRARLQQREEAADVGTEKLPQLNGILHALAGDHHTWVLGVPEGVQDQRETGNMGWQFGVEAGRETTGRGD